MVGRYLLAARQGVGVAISVHVVSCDGFAPLCVEVDGLVGCDEVGHALAVVVGRAEAVGLSVPAREDVVAIKGEGVGGECLRLAAGNRLVGHRAAAAVGVEVDGVGARPLGVERDSLARCDGQVSDARAVGVGCAEAVGLSVPARENVVLAGEGVGGQCLRLADGKCLVGHRAAAAVGIEADGVGGRPLRVEVKGCARCDGQVSDARAVSVGCAEAVGLGVPSRENVVLAGEGVGG